MRSGIVAVAVAWLGASPAMADDDLYDRLWPQTPRLQRASFGEQLTHELTEIGNELGYHLDVLSRETVRLRVDGRLRRAYVTVGGGDERYLTLRLAQDIHFTEGLARIESKLAVRIAGRRLELELPMVELAPARYRDERGLELRLPLIRRRW